MSSAQSDTFVAPPRITAANREQFRKAALGFIDQGARNGVAVLTIDLGPTEELDASGLGLLVQMQKRSEDVDVSLQLVNVPKHIRQLLLLTRLEHLFTIIDE